MSRNILSGPTRWFDIFCANDKILSLRPKGSIKTKFSKNSCFQDDKRFWPIFPRIIECDKPQGTNYKGAEAFLTKTLDILGAFFQDL